jgi:hypothetical protein
MTLSKEPKNLLDCQNDKFEVIFDYAENLLPTLYPDCKECYISYQKTTQKEKETMVCFVDNYRSCFPENLQDKDSAIFNQKFVFTDLAICQPTKPYNSNDSCAFYTDVIYHTKDFKVQFLRLFQTGKEEFMDVFLDLTGQEPRILAFG